MEALEVTAGPPVEDLETSRTILADMLTKNDGCVSTRALRKALEMHSIQEVDKIITLLRFHEPMTPNAGKLHFKGRSFLTEDAFLRQQEQVAESAEVASQDVHVSEAASETEGEAAEAIPKKKVRQKEEAKLGRYVLEELRGIYVSDRGPEAEYAFDVHNDRGGGDYENVDLLAVHWRAPDVAEVVAVEVKLEFTAKLVQQANNYRRFADRVWIALPVDAPLLSAASALRMQDPLLFDYVTELGIGIIACRRAKGKSYETVAIQWPRACDPNRLERAELIERHRRVFEEAHVVAPSQRQAYPKF